MSSRKYIVTWVALMAMMLVLASCGNGKRSMERLVAQLAGDGTVDAADWKQLVAAVEANRDDYAQLYENGKLQPKALEAYVSDVMANRRPPREVKFTGREQAPLVFRIYRERSGSMTPYDSPQGDGSYAAAITALRNRLPGKTVVEEIGDQGYTDFGAIFDQILNKTGEREVSVLVTDMIYSVRGMQDVNPQRVFADMQGMITSVFKEQVAHKCVLLVQMEASYDGPYYCYDGSVRTVHGRRPYYIIMVGSREAITRIATEDNYRAFADFKTLKGYRQMYLYDTGKLYEPYYSILLSGPEVSGRFVPERGQSECITSVQDVEADRDGKVKLAVAVDMRGMLVDERYLTDVTNYRVVADDPVRIERVRPITDKDLSASGRKYAKEATHLMVLSMERVSHKQQVGILLQNRLPGWVAKSSSDDDRTVDGSTTFGLRYLMEGIYDAYHRMAKDDMAYFEIALKLDK